MFTIGFTGPRTGMNETQKIILRADLEAIERIDFALHGGCQGADIQFAQMIREIHPGCIIERYPGPPNDPWQGIFKDDIVHPNNPGHLDRNRVIVDRCDVLYSTPFQDSEPLEKRAGGTWYTIRYARKVYKRVLIFYPNGAVDYIQNGRLF